MYLSIWIAVTNCTIEMMRLWISLYQTGKFQNGAVFTKMYPEHRMLLWLWRNVQKNLNTHGGFNPSRFVLPHKYENS
jgi:hypothetical protein